MPREIIYRVTGHFFTMMGNGFGWIQLGTNDKTAGYIYVNDAREEQKDRFGGESSGHPYMVTHMPLLMWDTLLGLLKTEHNLFIRGYEGDNGKVSVFLYTSPDVDGLFDVRHEFPG